MSKVPWIKWYSGDFLNGIADLSPHEIALYTVILCRIYDEDRPIPHDIRKLARRCNMRLPQCERALQSLLNEGKLTSDGEKISAPIVSRWASFIEREHIPKDVQNEVRRRDGEVCQSCGSTTSPFHLDHIIPISQCGTNDVDNLTVACPQCNLSKGAKTPKEWIQ